jgi:hypothetical protein
VPRASIRKGRIVEPDRGSRELTRFEGLGLHEYRRTNAG